MLRISVLIACLFSLNNAKAQTDFLIKAAAKAKNDSAGMMAVYTLAKDYLKKGKFPEALAALKRSYIIAEEIKFIYGQAIVLQVTGNYYMSVDEDSTANFYYTKSLDLAKKWKIRKLISANLTQMALILRNKNKYVESLNYYENALSVAKELGDTSVIIPVMINLASLYGRMENPEKEMKISLDILKMAKKLKHDIYSASASINLGNIFSDKGDTLEARYYFNYARNFAIKHKDYYLEGIALSDLAGLERDYERALELHLQSIAIFERINDQFEIARITHNIGYLHLSNKNYSAALTHLLKAKTFFESINNRYGMCLVHAQIARCHLFLNNLSAAIEFAGLSLREAEAIHSLKNEAEGHRILYEINKKKGNNKAALFNLENYNTSKDSLNVEKKNSALNVLKTKMELEKQEELLTAKAQAEKRVLKAEREKENIQQRSKQTRQILISLLIGIVLTIVSIFSFFLYKRFKVIETQKILIEKQKAVVEEKQKEILDSIRYAKRIQTALLTSEKYIERSLGKK